MHEEESSGAGEAKLRQRVNGERHVARDDETTDDARDDRDDESRRYGVLNELVAEERDELLHQLVSP